MKKAYLGIDASKGYADFILLDSEREPLSKDFKLPDTRSGHDDLERFLNRVLHDHELDLIMCGLESTGGYENNWHYMLRGLMPDRVIVKRINPRGVRHEKEASLVRSETDKVSARAIAVHLINQESRHIGSTDYDVEFYQARKFYRHIQAVIKDQTRVKNRLEKLIYESFPELLGMAKGGSITKWIVRLLMKYPSAQKVASAPIKSLIKIQGITKEKAEALKKKAKSTVGVPCSIHMQKTIEYECMEIQRYETNIAQKKKYLETSYVNDQIKILMTIKGIGHYSATGLVMEIEDANRFKKASSLSAFFGVYPEYKESGDGKLKPRMSKKGRASCRAILYMAARNVVIHNEFFKGYYTKHRKKGMVHTAAIGVVMNKVLRVVWGMLKRNKPFDPNIDLLNQQRPVGTPNKNGYHAYEISLDAPISARQRRKIRAMQESQGPKEESSTRSSISLVQT
jgi:transposase